MKRQLDAIILMKKLILLVITLFWSMQYANAIESTITIADSFGERTGLCLTNESWQDCEIAGRIDHTREFTTYLLSVSNGNIIPIKNFGVGGNTCHGDGTYYTGGRHNGMMKGFLPLLKSTRIKMPASTIIVVMGFNDIHGPLKKSPESTIQCIRKVWEILSDQMFNLVVMTYPIPTPIWSQKTVQDTIRLNQLIVQEYHSFLAMKKQSIRLVRLDKIPNDSDDGLHLSPKMARLAALLIAGVIK